MEWPKLGAIGCILLAAYLIIVGVNLLIGMAIPAWAIGLLAVGAGVLILVGR